MTHYPSYAAPYQQAGFRPTSVTVLAIVGIIWGVLMLLCNGFGLVGLFAPNMFGPNPAMDAIRANPIANTWSLVSPVIGLALTALLIAASSAALGLRGWARTGLIVFAVLEILVVLVGLVITIAVMNPIMTKALQQQMAGNPAMNPGMINAIQQGGAVIGVVIALVLPVWILIVMNRPNVKAAFAGGGGGAGVAAGGGAPYPPAPPAQYGAGQFPPQGPYGQQ